MNLMPETMNLIEHALELEAGSLRRVGRPLTEQEITVAAAGLAIAETSENLRSILDADVKMRRRLMNEAAQLDNVQLRQVLAYIDNLA